jgi:hypothetical protein
LVGVGNGELLGPGNSVAGDGGVADCGMGVCLELFWVSSFFGVFGIFRVLASLLIFGLR